MRYPWLILTFGLLLFAVPVFAQDGDEAGDGDENSMTLTGRTRAQVTRAANQNRKLKVRAAGNRQRQRAAAKAHPTKRGGGLTMNKVEPRNPRETSARRDLREKSVIPVGDQVEKPPEGSTRITVGRLQYHYQDGTFYRKQEEGFVIVPPPVGALVPKRPKHSSTVRVKEDRYYFQSGYFYKKEGRAGYRVVPPPVGAVVPYLPKGYTAKIIYGDRYYEFAGALYNPIVINGRRYYQTVRIRGR